MKNLSPLKLTTIGALVLASCVSLVDLLSNDSTFLLFHFVSLFLGTFICAFLIFYLLINRFINERLKFIYKTIRKGKTTPTQEQPLYLTTDVIAQVEEETQRWTEERNKEISRLKEQEAFRREFLGNLAHELKTPIFSVQGYILTLLDGGLEDETINRLFLERASKATDRMVNIIEDLDQITKLEVDAVKLEMRSFDIVELIQELIGSLDMMAKEKAIRIRLSREYNSKFVVADRGKIGQVLSNLLVNSIFYGNEHGTTEIRLNSFDDILTIEVSDNGPGIEDAHLGRLFERFYRVEKSRNRNEGGSGLGLAIAKHIIESHGHTISVRSTIGVGSTFSFSLDLSKSQNPALYSSRGIQIK